MSPHWWYLHTETHTQTLTATQCEHAVHALADAILLAYNVAVVGIPAEPVLRAASSQDERIAVVQHELDTCLAACTSKVLQRESLSASCHLRSY